MNQHPSHWLLFLLTGAGSASASRVRVWRALKALGAAILRDGVYLLPARPNLEVALGQQALEVKRSGGQSFTFTFEAASTDENALRELFNRSPEFATLSTDLRRFGANISTTASETEARRTLRGLGRTFNALAEIDYFPGRSLDLAKDALARANAAFAQRYSPGEPHAAEREIVRLDRNDFQNRIWATREHLWVDRVASAWLIRRFIDPQARFRWLSDVRALPKKSVGFDFDGATFTHVGNAVTFEVLLQSFQLSGDPGLEELGKMVRSLDVEGSLRSAEAAGFEALMTGAREQCRTDDELLEALTRPLDFLHSAFSRRTTDASQDSVEDSIGDAR